MLESENRKSVISEKIFTFYKCTKQLSVLCPFCGKSQKASIRRFDRGISCVRCGSHIQKQFAKFKFHSKEEADEFCMKRRNDVIL